MPRRCSICRQTGHDARAHKDVRRLVEKYVSQWLDHDGACEDGDGSCPVEWELLCRYCQRRLCVQHAPIHGCADGWVAHRLDRPTATVLVVDEGEE